MPSLLYVIIDHTYVHTPRSSAINHIPQLHIRAGRLRWIGFLCLANEYLSLPVVLRLNSNIKYYSYTNNTWIQYSGARTTLTLQYTLLCLLNTLIQQRYKASSRAIIVELIIFYFSQELCRPKKLTSSTTWKGSNYDLTTTIIIIID